MKKEEKLFSTIIASTVHDIKNSLGMMLNALEDTLSEVPEVIKNQKKQQYSIIQYESSRLNTSLMQLLALYKMDNNQLPFNPNQYNLYDFVEEQVLMHSPLLEAKNFNYEIDIDEELEAVFDETLLSMVVSNIIGNSIRYAHSKIYISATANQMISVNINDDGPGYPEKMLQLGCDYMHAIDKSSGSTGLGLYFAKKVSELHCLGERKGTIQLSNGGKLGGGEFIISIP